MAFFDNDSTWSAQSRQPSFEQQPPPSRSGAASAMSQQTESNAFALQFEEIERATDNLMKSGNWLPSHLQAGRRGSAHTSASSRNLSMGGDLDAGRPGSAGLQGFYAGQRFPAQNRHSEAEQMLQAKRRMAAQRERELRNYHQEQQYNRKDVSGAKTDRAMSPNTMSEEDRRELIARQHRALYGDNSTLYNADGTAAARPVIGDLDKTSIRAGDSLTFAVTGIQGAAAANYKFSLVRMGSVTHSVNTDQRRVPLEDFSVGADGKFTVRTPADTGVMIPGHWYLFAIAPNGTPSVAKTVQIELGEAEAKRTAGIWGA